MKVQLTKIKYNEQTLLYGRFYSLADLKKETPAYASNKYLSEKTGWSERTISRVVDELKDWNLITTNYVKHGLTKTTRYVMPLSLEGASNPKQLTNITPIKTHKRF